MDWLMKMLGMQQQGGAPSFGMLGGGLNGSRPSPALPSAASGGMPMSGLGPGAPPPGGAGLWPGGAQPQGQPGAPGTAMNTAMNMIKGPQLQPAPWMQMMPMGTMRG